MMMKAAVQAGSGVDLREVPRPSPGPDEVLTRIHAAALNRADLGMAAGHRHGTAGGAGTVLGFEWAGEVVEVGSRVTRYKPSDRVMCEGLGGFAEYGVADHRRVFPLPRDGLGWREAATLPVALRTMHDALVLNGGLVAGETVLILGASSGVGLMGLQIARLMGARTVLGTSTTAERRARLTEFGATGTVDTTQEAWAERVRAATDGRGADLVIDMLSGPGTTETMRATAICGRIVNVGRLAGARAEFDFDLHALRRIRYIGVTFRTRTADEVGAISRAVERDLWPALRSGGLRLPIDRVLPLDDAPKALEEMAGNLHFGKIVLDCA
ncbi:putative quinone oxidoreductase [Pseudooceanicola batsensis HTCC2597]|uniref:Putative quinone oxidoreductase n=1 Tax=Pseudooceanicola batsensis (strain ATCC BAA-863 / DSM 15984 / KCTC 12145 / HTCC2597) TaxID=252305 RepID=A3TX32_PSEBH|nr:zinc-binding dehydrogenase [Pseudooceanicola batsensis]EAQ03392.1 putative quinone oxidoreductase [Pseudooceanicola batsensis HTCC2597]